MLILDATAGSRSIWYQKNNPFTIFLDQRSGIFNSQSGDKDCRDVRRYKINPNVKAKWQHLPFVNECFDMVVFDPPHIFQSKKSKSMGMCACYGVFYKDTWKQELSEGIIELFRILKKNGIFILKWCENNKPIKEIISLFPYDPMFGTRTGQKNKTHWITFLKYNQNTCLSNYIHM